MLKVFLFIIISFLLFKAVPQAQARITPEDIVNSQKNAYSQKVKNYSQGHKQKLENLSQKIADVNLKITDNWNENCLRQGQILDEYIRRNPSLEDSQKVQNARYWLTYAHEAVAYQAAKIYIFDLTSEKNIKPDSLNTISQLSSDLSALKEKVLKSQNIIKELVI